MSDKAIPIELLFPEVNWDDVKIHVAQKAGQTRPVDVFTRSFIEWQNVWNGDYHSNHCWNRKYIFSIIELPNETDRWLFGGIFQVISHEPGKDHAGKKGIFYKVDLNQQGDLLMSYCQELCMGKLGGDPFFFDSIDKVYSPDYFC